MWCRAGMHNGPNKSPEPNIVQEGEGDSEEDELDLVTTTDEH